MANAMPMPAGREGLAGGADDAGTGGEAAGGKRDVGGDGDIVLADAGGDPVVGRIRPVGYDHALDQRTLGQPHEGVGNEMDGEPVPLGHAHGLVFHGAGVGVDVDRCRQGLLGSRYALSSGSGTSKPFSVTETAQYSPTR